MLVKCRLSSECVYGLAKILYSARRETDSQCGALTGIRGHFCSAPGRNARGNRRAEQEWKKKVQWSNSRPHGVLFLRRSLGFGAGGSARGSFTWGCLPLLPCSHGESLARDANAESEAGEKHSANRWRRFHERVPSWWLSHLEAGICSSPLQSGFGSEVLKISKLLFYSFLLFTDFNDLQYIQ